MMGPAPSALDRWPGDCRMTRSPFRAVYQVTGRVDCPYLSCARRLKFGIFVMRRGDSLTHLFGLAKLGGHAEIRSKTGSAEDQHRAGRRRYLTRCGTDLELSHKTPVLQAVAGPQGRGSVRACRACSRTPRVLNSPRRSALSGMFRHAHRLTRTPTP